MSADCAENFRMINFVSSMQLVFSLMIKNIIRSVVQSCPTLCNPLDCSPQGSSVRGIFQARTLEWAATSSSRGSSGHRDGTQVSCIDWQIL